MFEIGSNLNLFHIHLAILHECTARVAISTCKIERYNKGAG